MLLRLIHHLFITLIICTLSLFEVSDSLRLRSAMAGNSADDLTPTSGKLFKGDTQQTLTGDEEDAKNIKTGNYNMVNLHYYSILKIVRNFNKIYTKKLKVKWISQKFLKEKILKNNTIKGWSPIKSNINDLLRVIKD